MSIRSFAREHQESVLVTLAILLIAAHVSFTAWGILNLTRNLTRAITIGKEEEKSIGFNFEGVKKLNLPGIE